MWKANSKYFSPGARNDTILELQEALITHCAKELNLKLYPVDDYHISLTRTVVLRHHWIQMFMASIKSNLEVCEKSTCILDCIRIYNNDEKTRSFIGISVAKEDEPKLMQIIQRLDLCLAEFNLEKFYEVWLINFVFVLLQDSILFDSRIHLFIYLFYGALILKNYKIVWRSLTTYLRVYWLIMKTIPMWS